MSRLFRRVAALQVGTVVVTGGADGTAEAGAGLRISFRAEKKLGEASGGAAGVKVPVNTAQVQVYNLAERSRREIDQAFARTGIATTKAGAELPQAALDILATIGKASGPRSLPRGLALSAGYQATGLAELYVGEAKWATSFREGTEWVTQIEASTGMGLHATIAGLATKGGPGATKADRMRGLLTELQKQNPLYDFTQAFERLQEKNLTGALASLKAGLARGFTVSGPALGELQRLARQTGLEVVIDDDAVSLLDPSETLGDAVVLSPDTGLIGPLRRVFDEKRPARVAVRGTSLLNPRIRLGCQLDIDSTQIAGRFKVYQTVTSGDTHGESWQTEFEAVQIEVVR